MIVDGQKIEFVRLYNSQETPFDVYSLAAFCQEHLLDYTKMRNMVAGRAKQYQGWHIDPERTAREIHRANEIWGMLGGGPLVEG